MKNTKNFEAQENTEEAALNAEPLVQSENFSAEKLQGSIKEEVLDQTDNSKNQEITQQDGFPSVHESPGNGAVANGYPDPKVTSDNVLPPANFAPANHISFVEDQQKNKNIGMNGLFNTAYQEMMIDGNEKQSVLMSNPGGIILDHSSGGFVNGVVIGNDDVDDVNLLASLTAPVSLDDSQNSQSMAALKRRRQSMAEANAERLRFTKAGLFSESALLDLEEIMQNTNSSSEQDFFSPESNNAEVLE